jgi:hypothetical protein
MKERSRCGEVPQREKCSENSNLTRAPLKSREDTPRGRGAPEGEASSKLSCQPEALPPQVPVSTLARQPQPD